MTRIESVWQEERVFSTPLIRRKKSESVQRAELTEAADKDLEAFWRKQAHQHLSWHQKFSQVLDSSHRPHFRWFADGKINVSFNCLDRHLKSGVGRDRVAIIFEGDDPADTRRITYGQLHADVCRLSNGLMRLGVEQGDRVLILMPHVPEAIVAMQACARLGLIHAVVFGGFSASSVRDRAVDTGAKLVITADGSLRGGKKIALKGVVDKALEAGCPTVEHVLVFKRTGSAIDMRPERDIWWHDLCSSAAPVCEPVWVESEHPLFILYTSGSTGKPKGIVHSSAGYLLGALTSLRWIFDLQPESDDVFWCTADVGWITGHTYGCYGPLALGTTLLMYEGVPTYPHGGRFWDICQRHGVSILYTVPTAIRALMRLGDDIPKRYDLSTLRLLGSVGEPINPEAWTWYHRVIGRERCPIVDTWWQTETGSIMIAPMPQSTPLKPGSCTLPLPGVAADVVDEHGDSVTVPGQGGTLVIKKPWPSMLRTIWNDDARYVETYWRRFGERFYVAGDGAQRDKDGYFWILGRIDDVLNVSGHRLGTMEIESAVAAHAYVAEAAVVGRPDSLKGESIFAFVVLKTSAAKGMAAEQIKADLRAWVADVIGAIAKPDAICLCENLPKTRSGKIMRRVLRSIACHEPIKEDISTLESEAIIEQLRALC